MNEPVYPKAPKNFESWDPEYDEGYMNNKMRAEAAREALQVFAEDFGLTSEDDETIVSDFFCDLMHFCEGRGVDFDDCVQRGRSNYEFEADPGRFKE